MCGAFSARHSAHEREDNGLPSLSSLNVYLFLRERERERERARARAREGQREGGQRIRGRLCADSNEPSAGLKLRNREIMT